MTRANIKPTGLSVGRLIQEMLTESPLLDGVDIWPILAYGEDVTFPYVAYRITQMESVPQKSNTPYDSIVVDFDCYDTYHADAVDIAEAVRSIFDRISATGDTVPLALSGQLADIHQEYDTAAGAHVITLTFNFKVTPVG